MHNILKTVSQRFENIPFKSRQPLLELESFFVLFFLKSSFNRTLDVKERGASLSTLMA